MSHFLAAVNDDQMNGVQDWTYQILKMPLKSDKPELERIVKSVMQWRRVSTPSCFWPEAVCT
jgi:hypothetical protein